MNFTPETIYTTSLSHQKPFTPKAFYANGSVTRRLLHHKTFLHQMTFPKSRLHQMSFCTSRILHQKPFCTTNTLTPEAVYTCLHHKVLHQRTCSRRASWPACLLHQKLLTRETFNAKALYTLYTKSPLDQKPFRAKSFYTRNAFTPAALLRQKPYLNNFPPKASKSPLHHKPGAKHQKNTHSSHNLEQQNTTRLRTCCPIDGF